jgi:hypothetical protein
MPDQIQMAKAQAELLNDDAAAQVLKFVLKRSAATGWMIAKELGQDTGLTIASLNKLRGLSILEGDGSGLDGFYSSTSLGYALGETISKLF